MALLPLFCACTAERVQEESPATPSVDQQTIILRAQADVPGSGPTKVVLDFPTLSWQDDDQIAVFDGTAKHTFSIPPGGNHGSSANFSGTVSEGASELYAVSPAAAADALSGGLLSVSLLSVQVIPSGLTASPQALL